MFYDPEFTPPKLVVRYVVGGREREALVLTNGRSLEDHVQRLTYLEELSDSNDRPAYVTWPLAAGGAVAIRIDSIVVIEAGPSQ